MRQAYEQLFQALERQDEAAVRQAMGARKTIHTWRDEDGEGPVHWASGDIGSAALLNLLLERPGANLEARGSRRRYTAMRIATLFGDAAKVRVLLDQGASIHAPHGPMEVDLSYLDQCNSVATAKLLIERGLPLDRASSGGATPLYWAATGGHRDLVDYLLAQGAEPGLRLTNGRTLLHGAARCNRPEAPAILARLLDLGLSLNVVDGSGQTPEDEARSGQCLDNLAFFERWREGQALRAVAEVGTVVLSRPRPRM